MSRRERLDAACLVGIMAILLILLGVSLRPASEPAAMAPVAAVSDVATDIATDSESEPSGIAGMTVGELLQDAWLSYETQLGTPQPVIDEQYSTQAEYVVSYAGKVPALPATYITIPSSEHRNVTHVFNMVASQRA